MVERICIFGCGYVGLTTAAVLAEQGHTVTGVDIDQRRVAALLSGRPPFAEPGLEELLNRGLTLGRLSFTTDGAGAVAASAIAMIAVGTPSGPDGMPDLSAVDQVVRTIASVPVGAEVVVVRSTVPPGTAERLRAMLRGREVVAHPEFLRQGSAVADMRRPHRRVLGGWSPEAVERVARLYPEDGVPVIRTDPATAELSKYAANGFLAAKVSYINAMARLCEALGADVADVARIMGLDPRIGPQFLQAGIGFGGSCLPKDLRALTGLAAALGLEFTPGAEALAVNEVMPVHFARRVLAALPPESVVAVLGLTFKGGTDDLRDSPALRVIGALQAGGARVRAYDPAARQTPAGLERATSPEEAARGADAVAVLTDWAEFRTLDWAAIAAAMRGRQVFDGRNVADGDAVRAAGLIYLPVGRPAREGVAQACVRW